MSTQTEKPRIIIEGESYRVNNFVNAVNNGELKSLREYVKDYLINKLDEFSEFSREEQEGMCSDLKEYLLYDAMSYDRANGGIEIYTEVARQYVAKWFIEEGIAIFEGEEVKLYYENNESINECMLHYIIVKDEIEEILYGGEIAEYPTIDDLDALRNDIINL